MANQKYSILYGGLSQEDELKGDSNSIQHQRMLLEKYARETVFSTLNSCMTMAPPNRKFASSTVTWAPWTAWSRLRR